MTTMGTEMVLSGVESSSFWGCLLTGDVPMELLLEVILYPPDVPIWDLLLAGPSLGTQNMDSLTGPPSKGALSTSKEHWAVCSVSPWKHGCSNRVDTACSVC